ncbi:hypothetical protein BD309DRAFT_587155 [Dichomitus squalens]|nr:hypothetical protein BD309DRAFT_587155 [Dichomitus squalens]
MRLHESHDGAAEAHPPASMLLAVVVALLQFVNGQSTNATCSDDYDWMRNSKAQSPCLITAWLQYPCYGPFQVPGLPSGPYSYSGPLNGSAYPCACNTVLYSMWAACAVCQGAGISRIYPYVSEVVWA